MLIKNAQILDTQAADPWKANIFDVHIKGEIIENIAPLSDSQNSDPETIIDAQGAMLIPGLHDHHIHLLSLLEAKNSVNLAELKSKQDFIHLLQKTASEKQSVRGVGYHEYIAGPLTSQILDEIVPDVPVKIQHRTGALWILNSCALKEQKINSEDGCILRGEGQPTNLKQPEELGEVFNNLNQYGVTGVTDATPGYGESEIQLFEKALTQNRLCDVTLMADELVKSDLVSVGSKKILLDDFELPDFEDLAELVASSHKRNQSVAIHSVTKASLAMCVAVFKEVGVLDGDRIEHASISPPELILTLAELGIRIVTQPNFILERGDTYLKEVEQQDQDFLYRCKGWMDAGVALAAGTDAPFGSENPWQAIWAAMDRKTFEGKIINSQERLNFVEALGLFLSPSDNPGGKVREIKSGAQANLCLLNAPLEEILKAKPENPVAKCIYRGQEL